MKFRRIGADFKVVARSYTRNGVALFFSLIFPIILIGLFGLIFSAIGSTTVTLIVLNEDHNSAVSQEFMSAINNSSVVKVQLVTDPSWTTSNFGAELGNAGDSVGLIIPDGFQANFTTGRSVDLTLYENPQDAQTAGPAESVVQGVANGFNLKAAHGVELIQIPAPLNVGSQVYTYIDYLIPGLIGFTILTSPMFSMVDIASSYRKEGIFKELSLTPLTRSEWLTSRIVWYVLLTFVTASIMVGAGVFLFGAHVQLTLEMIPFLIVGPFLFVSLGMLAGSVAKTPESAAIIGNIITFPMMFLSGTFFAVSTFPPYLQTVAHALPLYYIIDGLDQVMLFSNISRALSDLTIAFGISIIIFLLAVRLFKWRAE